MLFSEIHTFFYLFVFIQKCSNRVFFIKYGVFFCFFTTCENDESDVFNVVFFVFGKATKWHFLQIYLIYFRGVLTLLHLNILAVIKKCHFNELTINDFGIRNK